MPRADREQLTIEYARSTPLDMDQYRRLFITCRVPAIPQDLSITEDDRPASQVRTARTIQGAGIRYSSQQPEWFAFVVVSQHATYVVVLCAELPYRLTVLQGPNGGPHQPRSASALARLGTRRDGVIRRPCAAQ